jgi:SAM-dependent methyltransferase
MSTEAGLQARHATYFENHASGRRFPWSLYHAPIDLAVKRFLAPLPPGSSVLNVGAGLFLDLPNLPPQLEYTGVDLDPRAVEACRERFGQRFGQKARFEICEPLGLPFEDCTFDAAYATEVIEHSTEPVRWLAELFRVVRPGAPVLLTTPNYSSWGLKFLEATALEAIARSRGFTRKGIHPFRCTAERLRRVAVEAGSPRIETTTVSFGWVLLARMEAPRTRPPHS